MARWLECQASVWRGFPPACVKAHDKRLSPRRWLRFWLRLIRLLRSLLNGRRLRRQRKILPCRFKRLAQDICSQGFPVGVQNLDRREVVNVDVESFVARAL